ncbi:MAG: aminotransferase class V-fold PLP-dependent enzyme [Alphaproteobacteria bacterium]|nr:aminotransferase class V-fold PLP-dependent enzyme [Alphaproteobacteria bacterium]
MTQFGRARRADFGLEDGLVFLNHGSFGATPKIVLATQAEWRARLERNPPQFMRGVLPNALDESRTALAAYVGARPEDIGFIDNATAGCNAVLRSVALEPGDEVLSTSHVYNAVRNAIRYACRRASARYVEVALPFDGAHADEIVAALATCMSAKTRLVVVDHIASDSSLIFPIQRIAALCRERGVQLLIDGAYGPGHVPIALDALGADYYAGNGHKWLCAPKGAAFLWVRRDRQRGVHPLVVSHFMDQGFAPEFGWQGTRDPSAWLCVKDALAWRAGLSEDAMRTYCNGLLERAVGKLETAWNVGALTPRHGRAFMASLPVPSAPPASNALAEKLRAALLEQDHLETQIKATDGVLFIRITAFVYNADEDYARLAEAVPKRRRDL